MWYNYKEVCAKCFFMSPVLIEINGAVQQLFLDFAPHDVETFTGWPTTKIDTKINNRYKYIKKSRKHKKDG